VEQTGGPRPGGHFGRKCLTRLPCGVRLPTWHGI